MMHALFLGVLAAFLYVGAGGAFGNGGDEDTRSAKRPASSPGGRSKVVSTPPAGATPLPLVGPPRTALPTSAPVPASLSAELERFIAGLDGTYGLAVRGPKDGSTVLINAGHVFPTASLYKVLVLYRVYEYLEKGKLSPSSAITLETGDLVEKDEWDHVAAGDSFTVVEVAERMITASSNPAAYALARITGGWNPVMSTAASLGMKNTTWDGVDFVTTPADILHFFDLLGDRSLVSPRASDEMISMLLRQKINDRIPAGLPPGTKVAHKTGELAKVRNDAGIVFAPSGSYVIVMLSMGINPVTASKAEAEISRMVYQRMGY